MNINNILLELVLGNMGCTSIVDKKGKYTYISEAWSEVFNINKEEAVGKYASNYFEDVNIKETINTGKIIIYDNESDEDDIIYAAYIPLINHGVVCGVLMYREIKGMDNILGLKRTVLNGNGDNQGLCIDDSLTEKINNLVYFNDLKLKEKQDILIKKTLEDALKKSNGNKALAAKMLGISRTVIYDKLKKYNMM